MTTLYKLDSKNQIRVWQIQQEEDILTINHGLLYGKTTTTTKQGKRVNPGKANEQTPVQHAASMMQSLIKAKIEKEGYSLSLDGIYSKPLSPMLAQDAHKNWQYIEDMIRLHGHIYVQPKLDGNRVLCYVKGNDVIVKSRKGKVIDTLNHLKPDVVEFIKYNYLGYDVVLDGEIYKHGLSLQEINSAIKKPNINTSGLNFVVYDIVDTTYDYETRFLNNRLRDIGLVSAITTRKAYKTETINDYLNMFMDEGYEGAIIRIPGFSYESDKRSKSLLKLKSFEDAEFKVIGFYRVDCGYYKNKASYIMWQLETEKGVEFDVLAGGTIEEKCNIVNPAQYIGKLATIKFQGRTDNGIPKFGVFKCFREVE